MKYKISEEVLEFLRFRKGLCEATNKAIKTALDNPSRKNVHKSLELLPVVSGIQIQIIAKGKLGRYLSPEEVTGIIYSVSNNTKWYREFYKTIVGIMNEEIVSEEESAELKHKNDQKRSEITAKRSEVNTMDDNF